MLRETAQIVAITHDPQGIMHVRFVVKLGGGIKSILEEERTLSLESFRRLYPDPVVA
jgi:hypothetical protein